MTRYLGIRRPVLCNTIYVRFVSLIGNTVAHGTWKIVAKSAQRDYVNLGSIASASIKAGTQWVSLTYKMGTAYDGECGNEPRQTTVMITCNPAQSEGLLRVLETENKQTKDCYYLFELEHQAVCPKELKFKGLSVGSIVVIIFFVLVFVYLVGGVLYQRFALGAKGIEQIPHLAFWQDFGNLQADGCDFVCRWGARPQSPKSYRGIGDDQLATADEFDEELGTDEHLLPM